MSVAGILLLNAQILFGIRFRAIFFSKVVESLNKSYLENKL